MSLKKRLMEDLKTSMKNKDKIKKNAITLIRSSIKQQEVDTRKELNDEDIIEIMSKQIKQKKNSIEDFKKGNREDLIELTKAEISILENYMPEQLSDDELEDIVKKAIEETKAETKRDIGKVMSQVMPLVKGRADGNQVNKIVMRYLN
ncbi:MAG: GatB/YqeY domain-containing protein [Bacillota bacterium]|nr:GatB/YqeY domain-containing protein [Bacillota bacterium]